MSNGPPAGQRWVRQMASLWRQMYLALLAEGFTESEALTILGHTIKGSFGGGS